MRLVQRGLYWLVYNTTVIVLTRRKPTVTIAITIRQGR